MILSKWRNLFLPNRNELAARTVMTVPAWAPQGPWTGSNNLGNVVPYAPDANNRQTILKLDEWGPPDVWTVSLGITYDQWNPLDFLPACDVIAEIEFGCGGSTQRIELSWLKGTMISLPMNAISVKARYASTAFFGNFNPPPNLRLSAQLARGYHESNGLLAKSIYDGKVVPNTGPGTANVTLFNVPAFASQVKCLPITNAPSGFGPNPFYNVNNLFWLNAGTESDKGGVAMVQYLSTDLFERWIDIPPYVHSVSYADYAYTSPVFHVLFRIGV